MYITTIGFRNDNFEVEVAICDTSRTKEEADKVGKTSLFKRVFMLERVLLLDRKGAFKFISKDLTSKYQFRLYDNITQLQKENESAEKLNYKLISWNEAIWFLEKKFPNLEVFELESCYHRVYKGEFLTVNQE